MKRIVLFCIVLLLQHASFLAAQSTNGSYYRLPVDGSLSISANYGELRANHFHGGIDVRVGGVVGTPIYAVAEGYVSRISVSPTGYGKAIYITHPNGTTSVYGHLHAFSPKIKAFIEEIQYIRQRFAIDEIIDEHVLPVKQGEKIGTAGNSGSSFGPHLHLEIRETDSQLPVDIFARGYYKIPTDTYPPTIRSVGFFSFRQVDNIPFTHLFYSKTKPERNVKQVVNVPDTFYVGVDIIDTQNGTSAKLAVNRIYISIDDKVFFTCVFEDIPFDVSRHLNSAIAYDERIRSENVLLKTYIEPGNKLPIYRDVKNNGLIALPDTLPHTLEIQAIDDSGNKTVSSFIVKKSNTDFAKPAYDTTSTIPAFWDSENSIKKNGLDVTIPLGALYQSVLLTVDTLVERPAKAFSPLWHIHTAETPLQTAITIRMAATIPDSLKPKALLAGINSKGNTYAVGGRWHNNALEVSTRSFGDFFVTIDTVPPTIKPQFTEGANLSKRAVLKIKITDNLSGIANYNGYVDGEWVLFDYDAKNNVLVYTFDAKRIKRNKKHKLLLTVTDNKQNTSSIQTSFVW